MSKTKIAAALVAAFAVACGGSKPASVASVSISPTSVSLNVGASQQVTATAVDTKGQPISNATFGWAASDSTVVAINSSGGATATLTGLKAGSTTVTATTGGQSGSTTVTVAAGGGNSTLTVTSSGSGSGTITSSPSGINCGSQCSNSFPNGTQVTLTANPSSGSTFLGWSGACSGTATTCQLTLNSNQSVNASFGTSGATTHTVTVTVAGNGTGIVNSSPGGLSCSTGTCVATFDQGTNVTLAATPSGSSTFAGWSGTGAGNCTPNGGCSFVLTQDISITATFSTSSSTNVLTVILGGTGTGTVTSSPSGINCSTGTCTGTFPTGSSVTLTATAGSGSAFAGWGGVCSGTGNCSVTLNSDQTVNATFNTSSGGTHVLTVVMGGSGSGTITSSPSGIVCTSGACTGTFPSGTTVSLTATPSFGSVFSGFGGACSGTTCAPVLNSDLTVNANFTAVQQLNVTLAGSGSGTVTSNPAGISCSTGTCTGSFATSSVVTLTAAPGSGSILSSWSGCSSTNGLTCTVQMTGTEYVTATFVPARNLTVNVTGAGGTIASTPSGIAACSSTGGTCAAAFADQTSITLTPTASSGYVFTGWTDTTCSSAGAGPCTFTIGADTTVSAVFVPQFTVTLSIAGSGGSVSSTDGYLSCTSNGGSSCSHVYNAGTQVTLNASVNPGFVFNWGGACTGTSTTCTFTVSANTTVSASFAPPAPSGLTAFGGTGQATVRWNTVSNATGYNLYWSTTSGVTPQNGTQIGNATSPYVHSGLTNDTTYYYVVTAVNGTAESAPSAQATATPIGAPIALTAVAGQGSVTLSWGSVTGATAYNLYWSTTGAVSKASGSQIANVTSPYLHTGLTPNATYRYVVTAVDGSGESAESPAATATPTAAPDTGTPAVVSTQPLNGSAGANVNSPIVAVFSEPMSASTFTASTFTLVCNGIPVAGTVSYSQLTATFTPAAALSFSASCTATVKATVADADGIALGADSSWTFTAQPAAPTNLSTLPGNGEITVQWSPVSAARGYMIFASTTSGGPYSAIGRSVGPSFTQRGLGSPTTEFYVVAVITDAGESPYSAETSGTTNGANLPAPGGLKADARNGQVLLTWNSAGGSSSYLVWRGTSPGGPYTQVSGAASPSTGYTDSTVTNAVTYYYVVQNVGGGGGAFSDEAYATPTASLLAAPAGLTDAVGSTWVHLSWSALSGASGYALMRGTTPGGPYAVIANPPVTAFSDTTVSNGTSYYYVVAGLNAQGAAGAVSSEVAALPTNILSAETPVLSATPGNLEAILNWPGCAGATSYNVYWTLTSGCAAGQSGCNWQLIESASPGIGISNLCPATGNCPLSNGTTYYFYVAAFNQGPTVTSNVVGVTPSAATPGAPTITASPGAAAVTLSWTPVPGATGYNILRMPQGGTTWSQVYCCATDPYFTDQSALNGTTYNYYVAAAGPNTAWGPASNVVTATPQSNLPTGPVNFGLQGGNTVLTLTWAQVLTATSYNIYRRAGTSGWSLIGTSTNDAYYDTGLTNGTPYVYAVQAVNGNGSGYWSAEAVASTGSPNSTPPPAPTGVAAQPGAAYVTLTWNPVPGATGYNILRATTSGGYYSQVYCCAVDPYFVDQATQNGTQYYYVIAAENAGGQWSAFSPEVTATPSALLPAAPVNFGVNGGNAELTLSWDPVSAATQVTSYNVYRRSGLSGWTRVGTTPNDAYYDTTAANGITYTYAVEAVDSAGGGTWSTEQSATPSGLVSPAPSGVTAQPGNASITVTWNPVPGATGYNILRSTNSGGSYSQIYCCATDPYFTDQAAANNTTYYYVIRATSPNAPAWSANSAEASAKALASLPTAPTNPPSITGGDSELSLSWPQVSGATGYKVYRRYGGGNWALIATTTEPVYDDIGLLDGVAYTYAVAAVNGVGTGYWSPEGTATPAAADSLAPTGLAVQPGNAANTLTWTPVAGATGYNILRSLTPGGPYNQIYCCATHPLFTDTGLSNAPYYYVVTASLGSGWSGYSAEASGTPSNNLPAQPNGPGVTAQAGQLTFTWSAVSGATGYAIYRHVAQSGWVYSGSTTQPSLIDSGLTSGTQYWYAVAAINASGEGAWSNEASGTPQ